MRVYAFQGLRYSLPGAGALAAPPFDQIDDAARDRYHRIRHHFSHLTRPAAGAVGPAATAAATQAAWLAAGAIRRDPEPALYGYAIDLPGAARRLGLCALVGLEPPESGIVRPHEETVEKTVDERLALLRATRTDLEPILLLADDGGALDRLLAEDAGARDGEVAHRDEFGNLHRLWRLPAGRVPRYREALAARTALIADGHHRYRTACRYAAEVGAVGGPAAAKLAVVTSLASPALTIDPIHRGIRRPLALGGAPRGVVARQSADAASGRELAARVAAAAQPALAIAATGAQPEIWQLAPGATPAGRLAVVLLHRELLPQWGLPTTAATDGTILYRSDPDRLLAAVRAGDIGAAIWLPPMDAASFHAAVADGGLLPPKSTRFVPKVVSGLVWCPHDAALA